MSQPSEKPCARCGRTIEYRKKWARNWDEIKYCSDKCRNAKPAASNDEVALLELLQKRGAGKTICPSEILAEAQKQDPKRMEEVRQAARRLVHAGKILITQRGQVVDPSDFRGPIRLKLK